MIPKDYIERRGPSHTVLDGMKEVTEAPKGYYKLNLGCMEEIPTFTNLKDIQTIPWRFPTSSVTEAIIGPIFCKIFFLNEFMSELYRVLTNHGTFTVHGPYYTSMEYHSDSMNVVALTPDTFGWYSKSWCEKNGKTMRGKCDFSPVAMHFTFEDEWEGRGDAAKNWARAHYWNVIKEVTITLKAVKEL